MTKRLMVSMVKYEMTVLVGHTADDSREEILKKAYGASGEVCEGSEEVDEIANEDDFADYGVKADDIVDICTKSAADHANWSLQQFVTDTDEAARNRELEGRQMVMYFAPANPDRLRGVTNDMIHFDDHHPLNQFADEQKKEES